jgi:2-hydroxychromene-2-carboxylate isomerase
MTPVVDYYMSPSSPWTYLGHARFEAIAKKAGAKVNVKPVDYGVIFPASGGLPLAQRPMQRKAYRLAELKRWSEYLKIPLVIQPKFFPVNATAAAELICGAPDGKRMALAGDLLASLWRDDRNLADPVLLAELGMKHGVGAGDRAAYEANTREGLARQVFGAPTFIYKQELFWGQDRLDFLERALAK